MQIVWEEKRRSSGVSSAGTMRCAVQEQKAIVDVDGREMQARSAVRPRRPVRGRGEEELGDDTSCEAVCFKAALGGICWSHGVRGGGRSGCNNAAAAGGAATGIT